MPIHPATNTWPALKWIVGVLLALIVVGYGFFESFDLLLGPKLLITAPANGSTVHDSLIRIEGRTKRIAKIYISGRQIFAQSDGTFSEPLLLGNGYNIIEVRVEDQFGRKLIQKVELVLE
jgi:hypothetical protein